MFLVHFTHCDPPVLSFEQRCLLTKNCSTLDQAFLVAKEGVQEYIKDPNEWDVKSVIPKDLLKSIQEKKYCPVYEINTKRFRRRMDVPYMHVWIQSL